MFGKRPPMQGIPSTMQASYLTDPRIALAMEMQRSGSSTAPVSSHMQGISRMLQGALGAFQENDVRGEYQTRGKEFADALSSVGSDPRVMTGIPGLKNAPGPSMDGSAGYSTPDIEPGYKTMAKLLSEGKFADNPDLQEYSAQLQQKALERSLNSKPEFKVVGDQIVKIDANSGTVEPAYTASGKSQWESINDPMFGKGQRNTKTGEFKPVKTEGQDPAKADEVKIQALDVTNRLLNNLPGVRANRGGISTLLPNISDSAVNAEADLETLASLLTTENLGLLKGVLSDTDMKVLKDIGAGGLKGADEQVINNLKTIQAKLGGQLGKPPEIVPIVDGKLNLADPRVQEAIDSGFTEEQILKFLGGKN